MPETEAKSFETTDQLDSWLAANHDTLHELWVRIFKKNSGVPTVTWNDCVIVSLAWGWIDGQRRSLDESSFLQRLSPRRPGSAWSARNCDHAERLIGAGQMRPPGLAQVESARQDGRWARAYAGSAQMIIPDDFLDELRKHPGAEQRYEALNRSQRYLIYHQLQTAARPETRLKRIADLVARLAHGEPLR